MFKELLVITIIALIMYFALKLLTETMFKLPSDGSGDLAAKLSWQKHQAEKITTITAISIFCFLVLIASWVWVKKI